MRRAIAKVPWPECNGRPRFGLEQYAETRAQLEGWSCERRVIVTRTLKPNAVRADCAVESKTRSFIAGCGEGGVLTT